MTDVTLTKKLIQGHDARHDTTRTVLGPVAAEVLEDRPGGRLLVAFDTDAGRRLTAEVNSGCYLGYVPEGTPVYGQEI